MTLQLESPTHCETRTPSEPCPQGAMLLRIVNVLERAGIPYCLLHGYENYPQTIDGDVDCLIPAEFLPHKLARVLHENRDEIGARVVQWFEDGAHFVVLAGRDADDAPIILQLHTSSRYEMAGRVIFDAGEILRNLRSHEGFFIPEPGVAFTCVLANKLAKGNLSLDHGRRLSALFAADPDGCEQQLSRFLHPSSLKMVTYSAQSGNWEKLQHLLPSLRNDLFSSPNARPAGRRIARLFGKLRRWIRPRNGFHAVFLGPDGVGKSTTIEVFQRDLAPVFLSNIYLTFAPGLLPQKFSPPKPDGPHSLPPRSMPASLLKAAWWLICYTLGYFAAVRPTLARGGLVVNHRYLVDAIVDQKRYRYSGPVWLLKLIWKISPKPDVVFLLDAPPEVIQRRKQEVPLEETARQVAAYRRVIGSLPIGKIIDAARPRQQVAAEVEWLVLDRLADRIAQRCGMSPPALGGRAPDENAQCRVGVLAHQLTQDAG